MEQLSNLTIQPSFKCNYNCSYCYLGKLREDNCLLDLGLLNERLVEIRQYFNIGKVQILGGEPSILEQKYFYDLYKEVSEYKTSVVSNFSNLWLLDFCLQTGTHLTVSFNEERPHYKDTLSNLRKCKGLQCISLSSVVLPSLIDKPAEKVISTYDELGFNVFFLKYNQSVLSQQVYDLTTSQYTRFLEQIILEYRKENHAFKIENESLLNDTEYKASCDHFLFINPNGKYSTITYTGEMEQFVEFDSLEKYISFSKKTYEEILDKCKSCDMFNECQSRFMLSSQQNKCKKLFELRKRLFNE